MEQEVGEWALPTGDMWWGFYGPLIDALPEVTMTEGAKHRVFIDLEKLNQLNAEGCRACRKKFNLGDEVVLARGEWKGYTYIHEREAVFEKKTNTYYERRYFADKKRKPD